MYSKKRKTCFVIAPIGEQNSDTRKYSDRVLNYIIKLKLEPLGYKVIRADAISEPGSISLQIINHLKKSEIVIADLTGKNPNVMYELAIRHVLKKPVILIVVKGEKLPFDIIDERTIFFDITDIAEVENAKTQLEDQVKAIEKRGFIIESPFSITDRIEMPATHLFTTDEQLLTISDDVRYIKGILKSNIESVTKEPVKNIDHDNTLEKTKIEKWIKIRIEYPTISDGMASTNLEISSEESMFSALSSIWAFLNGQEDSKIKPGAYTYLWDWILIKNKNKKPLIIEKLMYSILATNVFHNGEIWLVVELSEPLLHKPERFGIKREHTD